VSTLIHGLLEWGAGFSAARRPLIGLWRKVERAHRATVTEAVLMVFNESDQLLVLASPAAPPRLPVIELQAREAITTQVEDHLFSLQQQRITPTLVAIEGTPQAGVVFLYHVEVKAGAQTDNQLWVNANVAFACLGGEHGRLLRLCLERLNRS